MLVWAHLGPGVPLDVAPPLLQRLREEDEGASLLVTTEPGQRPPAPPEGALGVLAVPADHPPFARGFLDRWRPDACAWISGRLRPALLDAALARMPVVVAGARAEAPAGWALRLPSALLGRAGRVLALDARDAQGWRRLGAPTGRVEVAGPLQACALPAPDDERARRALAGRLAGRPVWFAPAVPGAAAAAVLAAHEAVLRRAHRALLVMEPASGAAPEGLDPARAVWHDPETPEGCPVDDAHEIVVAGGPSLRGLWYRMAPVTLMAETLMAETLVGGGAGAAGAAGAAHPDAPAALGSALVHGPHHGAHHAAYARLVAEGASLEVAGPEAAAAAVEALLAPDRAARQAHAAWSVVTEGAEATDRLAQALWEAMDG